MNRPLWVRLHPIWVVNGPKGAYHSSKPNASIFLVDVLDPEYE